MENDMKIKTVMGFTAIYLIWGGTYLAIRFGIESIPPFMLAGVRFLISGILVYGLMRLRGTEAPRSSHWLRAGILGLLMIAAGPGLVTWAEQKVPSGLTSILVSMAPMWMVLADWISPGGRRPARDVVFGLFLGFAGVAMLVDPFNFGNDRVVDQLSAFVIIFSTLFWVTGSIYSRHALLPTSRFLGAGMQMMIGGGILMIVSYLAGEFSRFEPGAVTTNSWLGLAYLIVFGSIGFGSYLWLLSVTTVARVSTYAYVNPAIALLLGSLLAGEPVGFRTLECSLMILVAVIIIITARSRTAKPVAGSALSSDTGQPFSSARSATVLGAARAGRVHSEALCRSYTELSGKE